MICEYEKCKKEHDGSFGSGRFCSKSCRAGFSTFNKRNQINFNLKKIRNCKECGKEYVIQKGLTSGKFCSLHRKTPVSEKPFEEIKISAKKSRLIKERGWCCENCKLANWCGSPIPLELDHINGNADDDSKENLRLLCRNCHGLTDTFSWKNRGRFPLSNRRKKIKAYFESL